MSTTSRTVIADSVHDQYAANAARLAGPTVVVARAYDRSHAQVSRWRRNQTRGPLGAMLQKIADLIEKHQREGANGFVVLGELMAFLNRKNLFRHLTDSQLMVRYYELLNKVEPVAEMNEDVASRGRDLGEHRDALVKSGAADFELAAAIDEVVGRKLRPDEWSPQGHRIVRPIK